ncbi:MAG: hypothetical protein FJX57_09465 [Alphaproteobacteria bacterium]|nr:hypothetical protein [Alphaproteobacteria bacterium]
MRDPRIVGLVLVNPQEFVGDPDWGAYTWAKRYWSRSIFRPRAWLNLLTGRINYRRLWQTLLRQVTGRITGGDSKVVAEAKAVEVQLRSLADQKRRTLFVLSDDDVSIEQLSVILGQDVRGISGHPSFDVALVPGADHLFTRRRDKSHMIEAVGAWLQRLR